MSGRICRGKSEPLREHKSFIVSKSRVGRIEK